VQVDDQSKSSARFEPEVCSDCKDLFMYCKCSYDIEERKKFERFRISAARLRFYKASLASKTSLGPTNFGVLGQIDKSRRQPKRLLPQCLASPESGQLAPPRAGARVTATSLGLPTDGSWKPSPISDRQ